MRIGELAKTVGVTPDTIRYYEREGLLPPPDRTPSGYRDYGPEVVDDLQFIKKAQALGLKLSGSASFERCARGMPHPSFEGLREPGVGNVACFEEDQSNDT